VTCRLDEVATGGDEAGHPGDGPEELDGGAVRRQALGEVQVDQHLLARLRQPSHQAGEGDDVTGEEEGRRDRRGHGRGDDGVAANRRDDRVGPQRAPRIVRRGHGTAVLGRGETLLWPGRAGAAARQAERMA